MLLNSVIKYMYVYRIQTSLSLGGEDPLDLQIPTPRSHTNSATSVASYISVSNSIVGCSQHNNTP